MTAHTRLWSWLWREKVSNRKISDIKRYNLRSKAARNVVKQQETKQNS